MTLDAWLKAQGIRRAQFAATLGRHPSYITHLCAGRLSPSLSIALIIARETGGAVPVESWQRIKSDATTTVTAPSPLQKGEPLSDEAA